MCVCVNVRDEWLKEFARKEDEIKCICCKLAGEQHITATMFFFLLLLHLKCINDEASEKEGEKWETNELQKQFPIKTNNIIYAISKRCIFMVPIHEFFV